MSRTLGIWMLVGLLLTVGCTFAAKDKVIAGFPPRLRRYSYVIVVMEGPRVGSGFMMRLLNECRMVHVTDEVLYEHRRNPSRTPMACLKHWTTLVHKRAKKDRGRRLKYLGMKTQWLDLEPVSEYVASLRPRIVFLHRKNRVKQAISMCNAHKSGIYHSSNIKAESAKLTCPLPEFTRLLNRFNSEAVHSWNALYADDLFLGNPYHLVSYEDLSADPIGIANRVFRFLGLSRYCRLSESSLDGLFVKQVSDDLQTSVANFQELYDSLDGNPFQQQMLGVDDFILKVVGNETAT